MRVRSNIQDLCAARDITSGYQLQHRLGLRSPTVAQALFDATFTRISLETMARLCAGLECGPGDLFTFEAEPEEASPAKPRKGKRR